MRFRSFLKTGGALLTGLSTAISIILDASEVPARGIDWQWYALATFLVFCIFIGLIIYGQHKRIDTLENLRPMLSMRLIDFELGKAIVVTNTGHAADVWARAEIISGVQDSLKSPWYIPWNDCAGEPCRVPRGDSKLLRVTPSKSYHLPIDWPRGSEPEEMDYICKLYMPSLVISSDNVDARGQPISEWSLSAGRLPYHEIRIYLLSELPPLDGTPEMRVSVDFESDVPDSLQEFFSAQFTLRQI